MPSFASRAGMGIAVVATKARASFRRPISSSGTLRGMGGAIGSIGREPDPFGRDAGAGYAAHVR